MYVEKRTKPAKQEGNITVQVLAFYDRAPTLIYLVLDKGDPAPTDISVYYGGSRKPRGWTNPGGGLDKDKGETVMKAGSRELQDESGFWDFTIVPANEHRLPLLRHDFKNGHTVFVLHASIHQLVPGDIKETDEIERGQWFDLAISPVEHFRDMEKMKCLPYWWAVRRILMGIDEMDRNLSPEERPAGIRELIHPAWRLVFPVGRGDPRFPKRGFLIPPHAPNPESKKDWGGFMMFLIENGIENPDLDCIYDYFQEEISMGKGAEAILESCRETLVIPGTTPSAEEKEESLSPEELDKWQDAILQAKDLQHMRELENERYREWMEKVLAEKSSV